MITPESIDPPFTTRQQQFVDHAKSLEKMLFPNDRVVVEGDMPCNTSSDDPQPQAEILAES